MALVLIGNFVILRLYGDTLRSTNLFIVRSTVFYPVAWLNLMAGVSLVVLVVWEWLSQKKVEKRSPGNETPPILCLVLFGLIGQLSNRRGGWGMQAVPERPGVWT